jgi:hypothetical protein
MAVGASTSSTLTIAGSGFYPSGSATITVTASGGAVTTYTFNADATGAISGVISCASISGILTASLISIFATDNTYGVESNTVQVPIEVTPLLDASETAYVATMQNWAAQLQNSINGMANELGMNYSQGLANQLGGTAAGLSKIQSVINAFTSATTAAGVQQAIAAATALYNAGSIPYCGNPPAPPS